MTQAKNVELLGKLFTTSKRENGDEYIHFTSESMNEANVARTVRIG